MRRTQSPTFFDRSLVVRDRAGRLTLSEQGWALLNAINERWATFEARQLLGLPAADVAFARRFFRKLIDREVSTVGLKYRRVALKSEGLGRPASPINNRQL